MTRAKYVKWTAEETKIIKLAIDEQQMRDNYSKISWVEISEVVKTKTPRQCFDWYEIRRYRSSTKSHRWTKNEIKTLLELHAQGKKAREISDYFEGMSVSQVRNKLRYMLTSEVKLVDPGIESIVQMFASM